MTAAGGVAEATGAPEVSRVRELAGALLVYLMLAFLFTSKAWQDPINTWIGRCCDPQQFMWFLAWPATALELGQNPLLTDRLNAPEGANLMWNAAMPLLGLVFSPLTHGLGPILAYNIAVVAGIALSGLACFAALRRYTDRPLGPLVGGALYAFSPFVVSHTALHLNMVHVWAPPLFLILLDEIAVRRRHRPEVLGAALGIVGAIQLLTFEELLATSALAGLLLVLVMAIVVYERGPVFESTGRLLRAVIPGVATFLLIGGLPLAVQFFGPQQLHGQVQPPAVFSTDLLNVIVPTDYTLIAPDQAQVLSDEFSGLHHEATGYIGLPMLLVLAWILFELRRDRRVVVAGLMGIILLALSLGPDIFVGTERWRVFTPWEPIGSQPLIEHALPGRMTLYMWLAIPVMLAIAIDRATSLRRRAGGMRLAAIGLALVFLLPAPAGSSDSPIPPFFDTWEEQGIADHEVVLIAPWFTNGAGADPMLWTAYAKARPRMYEGYVYVPGDEGKPQYGPSPGRLARLMMDVQDHGTRPVLSAEDRAGAIKELTDVGVAVVIIGPLRYRTEMIELFTNLLGRPPLEVDGVQLWRDVQASIAAG